MSNANSLWKNLYHQCFSNFQCFPTLNLPSPSSSNQINKNFNSLYDLPPATTTTAASGSTSKSLTSDDFFSSSDNESDAAAAAADCSPQPDLATIFASQRFFFSSPGRSNSIFESSYPNSPPPEPDAAATPLTTGGIAVQTDSPDPYSDFRRSMQEMVEAQGGCTDIKADWEFLHELLLCYLTLNPKKTHKFIVRAFADLIISLLPSSTTTTATTGTYRNTENRHRATS